MAKKPKDELSDQEAERRATAALRRALATPYKLQKAMPGSRKQKRTGSKKTKRP